MKYVGGCFAAGEGRKCIGDAEAEAEVRVVGQDGDKDGDADTWKRKENGAWGDGGC